MTARGARNRSKFISEAVNAYLLKATKCAGCGGDIHTKHYCADCVINVYYSRSKE